MNKIDLNFRKVFIATVMILIVGLTSCRPTAEDILNKYDTCSEWQSDNGKSPFDFKMDEQLLVIKYSYSLLSSNEEYVRILADRWFVADAENPSVKLPINHDIIALKSTKKADSYKHHIDIHNIKERFLLIGFEGIDPSESENINIPPLFFLVENNQEKSELLTDKPRLANNLFTASYEKTRFAEYSTLTAKKINLTISNNKIVVASLILTDENEVDITITDLDKWFENAKLKKEEIDGDVEIGLTSKGMVDPNKVMITNKAKLKIDFEIDEKNYVLSFNKGAEFFTEKTATGKYILLPNETAKLTSEPIIKEKQY